MTPQEIIQEIQKLPPSDWQRIKDSIEHDKVEEGQGHEISEEELEKHLFAKGIIGNIPESTMWDYETWEPVEIQGEPLSETVIRERG